MEIKSGQELSSDQRLSEYRTKVAGSLAAIASEIEIALRNAKLHYPVFLSVPSSSHAIAAFATPLDPDDMDWDRIEEIVCSTITREIGCGKLRGNELPCAAANIHMGAADLMVSGSDQTSERRMD
jgi:hypothetical protein